MSLFEKFRKGEPVSMRDPAYIEVLNEMNRSGAIVNEINKNWLAMMQDGSLYQKEAELIEKPLGKNASFLPPFQIDIGKQISIGENSFVNHSFTASAAAGIDIGADVLIAPGVSILTVNHDFSDTWILLCKPVTIKDKAWIGANVTICPGVTIGEGSVVGTGSVVTKDVPDHCIAVGNPARVIKTIDPATGEQQRVPEKENPLMAKIAELEKRITRLEDKEAIRKVLDTFNNTADVKDMVSQGALFTEDGKVIQHFGDQTNVLDGRKAITDAFGDYLATVDLTYHMSGQQTIEFTGEGEATARSYSLVTQILEREGKKIRLQGGAHYVDQMVKENGNWYIRIRDQYPDYQDMKEIVSNE